MNILQQDGSDGVEVDGVGGSTNTIDESYATLAASETRRRISSSTITLGVVVVLAGLGLFSMRMITRAVADSTMTELPPELRDRIGKVATAVPDAGFLESLRTDAYGEKQVPLDNISKNPFLLFAPPKELAAEPQRDLMGEKKAAWLSDVERSAQGIEVRSIMGGGTDSAVALVNGRVVRVGHSIDPEGRMAVEFMVREITPDAVILVTTNRELKMEQEVEARVRRTR
ncbi:MAG: hypothetical protein KDA22_14245 [Phycisphaerales bacterium]|nr:hypothetical protein [Phycisphaerales bacterium]